MKIMWHTEKRKISDLIPTEGNPRQLTDKQYKDLKKSLNKFDLAEIPAINQDNAILAGHMRLKILAELKGDHEIDVRVPNRPLTKKEAEEYLIRSNKNTGEWDMDALGNFDVEDLVEWGFEENELSFEKNDTKKETKEIICFEKTHILLSFPPEKLIEIQPHIEEILKISGIDYEQASN